MDPNMSTYLHAGVKSLYQDNALTDVVIRIEGQAFPCHRLVLSAVSPYFRSMFTNNFQEKDTEEVVLQSVKPEIFQCILQFIYYAEKSVITDLNVQDILTTSSMFLMQHLVNICEAFMSERISSKNAINLKKCAESIQSKSLMKLARDYILREFEAVAKEDEFLELKTTEIIDIINDRSLNVVNEEVVCDAVFRWLFSDEESRKSHLCEVFTHIRLPLTSPDYIFSLSKKYPFLYENMELVQILDEAKYFHCHRIGPNNCSSKRMVHRAANDMVNGMILVLGDRILLYSFQNNKWMVATPLPSDPGLHFASCVVGNNFFVSGGTQNKYGELIEFRPEENTWMTLSDLGKKRSGHALVANSQMFYLLGGSYGDKDLSLDVTGYNRKQNTYKRIGDLHTAVRCMDSALLEQKIYIFGGNIDEENDGSTLIQLFDLSTNQGSKLTQELAGGVTFTGATVVDEAVYLLDRGGHLLEFKNEMLTDIAAKTTDSIIPQHLSKRRKFSMCHFNGYIRICCAGTKVHTYRVHIKTGELINKPMSLKNEIRSESSVAIGTLSFPKKIFPEA